MSFFMMVVVVLAFWAVFALPLFVIGWLIDHFADHNLERAIKKLGL